MKYLSARAPTACAHIYQRRKVNQFRVMLFSAPACLPARNAHSAALNYTRRSALTQPGASFAAPFAACSPHDLQLLAQTPRKTKLGLPCLRPAFTAIQDMAALQASSARIHHRWCRPRLRSCSDDSRAKASSHPQQRIGPAKPMHSPAQRADSRRHHRHPHRRGDYQGQANCMRMSPANGKIYVEITVRALSKQFQS